MRHRRSGSNLIELMVVITLSSTLMVVAAGWIHQSLKLGSVVRERQRQHQSLMRMSRQLRDDVHSGTSMAIRDENKLEVTGDAGTVNYEIQDGGVLYQVRDEQGQITKEDLFRTAPGATVRWESDEMPDWISLVVLRADGPTYRAQSARTETDVDPAPDLHLRVPVNRDARMNSGRTP